ncbi:MAG TPA: alanyl-tRNA editing protein, partial [Sediminispirochaeta sp.]|nr:alanyl-tRNA editing protein [Sediminispirochaeta sp.]
MSKAIYYEDQYRREFEAEVVAIEKDKKGLWVELSRTAFYPEGGGQPADHGYLNGLAVRHVRKHEGRILHLLAGEVEVGDLKVGDEVRGSIDWSHRYDYMQQHTGQHLLSAVLYRDFGLNTVAIHQGEATTTIEIDVEDLDAADIRAVEERTMELIAANLPVEHQWVQDEDLENYDLRREPKVSGEVRLVSVGDYDSVACGGVHTAATGEVRLVKHVQSEKIRGRLRLHWKIGDRALEDYRRKHEIVIRLVDLFSAQPPELLDRVEASLEELGQTRYQMNQLESRLAEELAAGLYRGALTRRKSEGEVLVLTTELSGEGRDFLKKMQSSLPESEKWIFCGVNH